MCAYRIVLTDDHALFRQGLRRILEENADLQVIGEAGDGIELLNLLNVNKLSPHMIILDISMPNLNGIEATRTIKRLYPDKKILILTVHKDREYTHQAISAGAEGYLVKDDVHRELFSAIEKVRQGKIYLSPMLRDIKLPVE